MKKLTALLLVLAMLVTLAACTKKDEKKEPKDSTAPIETKAPAQLVDAPVLNINEIYGLSPEGQKATLANTLSLTDEDKAAVKEGNYKVAICMHQMDNDVNVMKVNTIKKILGDLGVETVVLLSKGEIDSKKVRVEFSLEDMDMSGFQKGATYEQIKAYVLEHTGLKVSSLYISQIKRKCGLDVGQNYNLSKKEDAKVPKCPPEKEAAIRDALKYFQMI